MNDYPCPQYERLPLTQAMIDALMRSIASGRKEVAYGTKKIVYHNVADQLKILEWMQANLNGCGTMGRVSMDYDNGLYSGRQGLYEAEEENFNRF